MPKPIDQTGKVYGRLTVVRLDGYKRLSKRERVRMWLCACACGSSIVVRQSALASGNTGSCGCAKQDATTATGQKNRANIAGKRFGHLVAVAYLRSNPKPVWRFKCDCGNEVECGWSEANKRKRTASCGCMTRHYAAVAATRHGMSHTKVHRAWLGLFDRCNKPSTPNFKNYGGRGITICERWQTFENFLADMGEPPTPKHSIDRKDTNGNYEPDNCRWATSTVQSRNQRRNVYATVGKDTLCLEDWAERCGVSSTTLGRRAKLLGSLEKAVEFYILKGARCLVFHV